MNVSPIKPIENFLNVDTHLLKMNFKFRFIVYLKPSFCLGSPHGVEIHKDKAGGVDCGGFEPTQWQQGARYCILSGCGHQKFYFAPTKLIQNKKTCIIK